MSKMRSSMLKWPNRNLECAPTSFTRVERPEIRKAAWLVTTTWLGNRFAWDLYLRETSQKLLVHTIVLFPTCPSHILLALPSISFFTWWASVSFSLHALMPSKVHSSRLFNGHVPRPSSLYLVYGRNSRSALRKSRHPNQASSRVFQDGPRATAGQTQWLSLIKSTLRWCTLLPTRSS